MTPGRFRALPLPLLLLTLALACSDDGGLDPNDPDNPNALGLAVGVRVDPATFPATGEFVLELVPSTPQGQSLVNEAWEITTSITSPAGGAATLLSQEVSLPDSRSFSIAIDIDNTGSMSRNDPQELRLDASARRAEAPSEMKRLPDPCQRPARQGGLGRELALEPRGIQGPPRPRQRRHLAGERQRRQIQQIGILHEQADELGLQPERQARRRFERGQARGRRIEGDQDAADVERLRHAAHVRSPGDMATNRRR